MILMLEIHICIHATVLVHIGKIELGALHYKTVVKASPRHKQRATVAQEPQDTGQLHN